MALNHLAYSPANILTKIQGVQDLAWVQTKSCTQAKSCTNLQEQDSSLATLLQGSMELEGLMPWSSNYTFLVKLKMNREDNPTLAIYKPGDGERPLWDFPDQTLSKREFTAYLISQVLGWPRIPTTVLRDGPHGLGSVQKFIEAEYEAHYFNMRDSDKFTEDFKQMALFDYIINNADRKGGHCLKDKKGKIWAIDHGLTFHTQPKLRTVIWEYSSEVIDPILLAHLSHLHTELNKPELCQILADLINTQEFEAFKKRVKTLVTTGQFPASHSGRNVPFPPI